MRTIIPYIIVLSSLGLAAGHAQNQPQTLKGVYAPPGMSGLGSSGLGSSGLGSSGLGSSGKSSTTLSAPDLGAVGVGQRFTVPGKPGRGDTLPQDVTATPIPDRPGYGAVTVNGRRVIVNLNTNRIVQTLD
jgi:Protein of unknown function (DUF1236)